MSLWQRLRDRIAALGGLIGFFRSPRPPEASEAFAMAVVALGAKMAKSDGQVTADEVLAFREIFRIEDADLPDVGRLYDLAREDVAGFDLYARQVARMFEGRAEMLETMLDGLFHIAQADGLIHENELLFLRTVAEIFALPDSVFERVRLRNLPAQERTPYDLLGVTPDMDLPTIRQVWRGLAARLHPDRLQGAGLPIEALRMTEVRLAEINAAFEVIRKSRSISPV